MYGYAYSRVFDPPPPSPVQILASERTPRKIERLYGKVFRQIRNKEAGVTFAIIFGDAFHEESLFGPLFPRTLYGKGKKA